MSPEFSNLNIYLPLPSKATEERFCLELASRRLAGKAKMDGNSSLKINIVNNALMMSKGQKYTFLESTFFRKLFYSTHLVVE